MYQDEPDLYWRFGETSGTTAADSGKSLNDGTYRSNGGGIGGPALGQAGVLGANGAAGFDGANDFVSSNAAFSNPTVYSEEAWFKTTTNRGGKIIGFGCSQDGQLRLLRPPRLHAGRRPARVRRVDRLHEHHHHDQLVQRRQLAPRRGRPSPATG